MDGGLPMDWHLRPTDRTNGPSAASTKRWVRHARHEQGFQPHHEVGEAGTARQRGVGVARTNADGLIILDGSTGEGGGQILRSALTLSLLTGRPFRITRIRANRAKPGLKAQHLTAVEAAAILAGAEVRGGALGSTELTFRPGPVVPRDLRIDIGTAGATALVLQTIALPLALRGESGVRVVVTGGTFNTMAPSFPYLETTWRQTLALLGMPVVLAMPRAGYFPGGGGQVEAWIEPATLRPLVLEARGALVRIHGVAATSKLGLGIADRMRGRAAEALADLGYAAEITSAERPGAGPGAAISLVAEFEQGPPATFVGLGERGKPAEAVADDAVEQLVAHLGVPEGALDRHNADQVLLPLAFAPGRSVVTVTEVTEHLRTNIATIRAFVDRPIRLEEWDGSAGGRVIVG